ncbi:hypothetical protein TRV_06489 [Trichophyton verrucosum HKI 0517]|uniref:Uncharacterized protein n=1 Tax=Trichophyton verrucosum (strain HKI 0517) TaxID=663202 RepID=D4DH34_TRIVH|nr:uncharacterized protein TRV_06489 [Trichophyton verrucosum HKI 0517]EFE38829.1 hypothetical protein TRV_06489 [Trichophyton verrucosum HKI 0517]
MVCWLDSSGLAPPLLQDETRYSDGATSCHVIDIICDHSSSAGVSRHRTSVSIRLDIVSSRTASNGYLSSGWVNVLQTFVKDCASSSTLLSAADNDDDDDDDGASLSTKGWRCLVDGLFPASACQPYCTQSPGRKAREKQKEQFSLTNPSSHQPKPTPFCLSLA